MHEISSKARHEDGSGGYATKTGGKGELPLFNLIFWVKSWRFWVVLWWGGKELAAPVLWGVPGCLLAAGAASGMRNHLFQGDGDPNLLKMLEFGGKKAHHSVDGGAVGQLFEASTPNSPRAGGRGPQQRSGQGVTKGPKKTGGKTVKTAPETPRGRPGTNLRKPASKGAWMTPKRCRNAHFQHDVEALTLSPGHF